MQKLDLPIFGRLNPAWKIFMAKQYEELFSRDKEANPSNSVRDEDVVRRTEVWKIFSLYR